MTPERRKAVAEITCDLADLQRKLAVHAEEESYDVKHASGTQVYNGAMELYDANAFLQQAVAQLLDLPCIGASSKPRLQVIPGDKS